MQDDSKKNNPPPIIEVTAERVGVPVPAPPRIEVGHKSNQTRDRVAMAVAIVLDLLQIGFSPAFAGGFIFPWVDILDGLAFLFFWRLLGWHFALLPGFAFKLIPIVDLAPTWTIAVALTIRAKNKNQPKG